MTRVMVCEFDGDSGPPDGWWDRATSDAVESAAQLVLLPEMPFAPWLPASARPDEHAWEAAATDHATWLERIDELGAEVVVTSRPITDETGHRYNEGIIWVRGSGIVATHRKTYLPDEPGFHEARWYERGPVEFVATDTPVGRVGFLICTELWFLEHARAYAEASVDLLLVPRATPAETLERWDAAGRVAAVCAGAFCLSSNRSGRRGETVFAGAGWIVDPEGEPLARTSPRTPTVTLDIDLRAAREAKATYPRYVER